MRLFALKINSNVRNHPPFNSTALAATPVEDPVNITPSDKKNSAALAVSATFISLVTE